MTAVYPQPIRQAVALFIDNDLPGSSGIAPLLLPGGPPAISGFVVAIIVDAVNGMAAGRPTSHVAEERLEGLRPFVTDPNASSSVVREVPTLWIGASLLHGSPGTHFSRGLPAHAFAMRRIGTDAIESNLTLATPARCRSAAAQVSKRSNTLAPAITEAAPKALGLSRSGDVDAHVLDCKQSAKSLASNVQPSHCRTFITGAWL